MQTGEDEVMRKAKWTLLLLLSCMILGMSGWDVQAAENLHSVMRQDRTSLKGGETINLTLKFDEYQEINKVSIHTRRHWYIIVMSLRKSLQKILRLKMTGKS